MIQFFKHLFETLIYTCSNLFTKLKHHIYIYIYIYQYLEEFDIYNYSLVK